MCPLPQRAMEFLHVLFTAFGLMALLQPHELHQGRHLHFVF
jgi:hypothetical protein